MSNPLPSRMIPPATRDGFKGPTAHWERQLGCMQHGEQTACMPYRECFNQESETQAEPGTGVLASVGYCRCHGGGGRAGGF